MQCTYKKGSNSLNNIQNHFVYNIKCENNNKIYIGWSIDPYKWFKHLHRPPKKMKHDIDMNKTINLTFKLVILYSNMHKYKVDKMENHYIQYFDSTFSTIYNNFKGKPTSYKKYCYLKRNNMICKCWSHMLWFSYHKKKFFLHFILCIIFHRGIN
jgi:hypothetical protein